VGMTREFFASGISVPVTVIKVEKGRTIDLITKDTRGYNAVRVGFGPTKSSKLTKSMKGFFTKKSTEPKKILKEFRCENIDDSFLGKEIKVNSFDEGDVVSVTGVSKGKGFAGHMKRHNFSGGRASHGKNSVMRKAGSVGAGTWPGKVWKGTRMAGRMGGDSITVDNLKIIKVDLDNNLLFVKGAIPGHSKSIVYIEK
jgi:large subunit ribosomal protein L3